MDISATHFDLGVVQRRATQHLLGGFRNELSLLQLSRREEVQRGLGSSDGLGGCLYTWDALDLCISTAGRCHSERRPIPPNILSMTQNSGMGGNRKLAPVALHHVGLF